LNPACVTFLRLATSTGARRSQLLGSRWAEIGFEHRAIGFTGGYVEGRGGPVLRATKTHLCCAIDDATMTMLLQHWRRALMRAQAAGVKLTAGFVFSDNADGGRPSDPNRSTKTFIDHRLQATLPQFRLHDLRHFWPPRRSPTASRCDRLSAARSCPRVDHARVSTTLNVYAHRNPGADRQAADVVADLIDHRSRSGTMTG
jgi:integrase